LLGAAIAAVISTAFAYLYSAVVCMVFALILVRIRPEGLRRRTGRGPGEDSVMAGLRYLRTQPRLVVLLAGVTAVGFGVDPVVTLTPALVAALGGGPSSVAVMASAFGTGAGVMLLTLRAVRYRIGVERVAPLGLSVLAVSMLLLALVPDVAVATGVLAAGGAGYAMAITSLTTMLQPHVEDAMRGRIMSFWSVTYFGSRPIAAALHGSVADLVSVRAAFLVTTCVIMAGAVVLARERGRQP
jgi:sugar phosphate permease